MPKVKWSEHKKNNNYEINGVLGEDPVKSVVVSTPAAGHILFSSSDYEGRIGFAERTFASLGELLKASGFPENKIPKFDKDKCEFTIPEGFTFGFLGDAGDHGPHSQRLQKGLADAQNAFRLIGNREAYWPRIKLECSEPAVIVRNAIMNHIPSWKSWDGSMARTKKDKCMLKALLDLAVKNAEIKKHLDAVLIQNAYKNENTDQADQDKFLAEHVALAGAEKPERASEAYIKTITALEPILLEITKLQLQEAAIKWTLEQTMGCGAGFGGIWKSTWDDRGVEINAKRAEKKEEALKEDALTQAVIDSFIKAEDAINYMKNALIAKRVGNVISVHGDLTLDSFKIPGTDLDIDSFDNIDQWIEAVNVYFHLSFQKLIEGKDLEAKDLSVLNHAIRFSVPEGKANFDQLKKEYENMIASYQNVTDGATTYAVQIADLRKRLESLEKVLKYDGQGSTIGNNQTFEGKKDPNNKDEMSKAGFKLHEKIVALIKLTPGVTDPVIEVGHAPTGDQGMAGMAYVCNDKGEIIKEGISNKSSGIRMFSIDPTYADQNGTMLQAISVFDKDGKAETILASKAHKLAATIYSIVDKDGKRLQIYDLKIGQDGKASYIKTNYEIVTNSNGSIKYESAVVNNKPDYKNTDAAYYLEHNLELLHDKIVKLQSSQDENSKKKTGELQELVKDSLAAIAAYRINNTDQVLKDGMMHATEDITNTAYFKLQECMGKVYKEVATNISETLDSSIGLLVVDWQYDFIYGSLPVGNAENSLAANNKLISMFGDGDKVVFSRDVHPKDAVWTKKDLDEQGKEIPIVMGKNFSKKFMEVKGHEHCGGCHWCNHCVKDTVGSNYGPGLLIPAKAKHVAKGTGDEHQFGGVSGLKSKSLGVIDHFVKQGVTTVVVSGLATDFCDRDSIRQLLAAGFNVIVSRDAVKAINPDVVNDIESIKKFCLMDLSTVDKNLKPTIDPKVEKYRSHDITMATWLKEMQEWGKDLKDGDPLKAQLSKGIGKLEVIETADVAAINKAKQELDAASKRQVEATKKVNTVQTPQNTKDTFNVAVFISGVKAEANVLKYKTEMKQAGLYEIKDDEGKLHSTIHATLGKISQVLEDGANVADQCKLLAAGFVKEDQLNKNDDITLTFKDVAHDATIAYAKELLTTFKDKCPQRTIIIKCVGDGEPLTSDLKKLHAEISAASERDINNKKKGGMVEIGAP